MTAVRINKYLAHTGLASRRQVDAYIEAGRIKVNDQPAELGMKVDPKQAIITFDGSVVSHKQDEQESLVYYKLYKPVNVISTADDPHGRTTVLDLIKTNKRLYPVGRLDADSEGLMLLTNDGQLTYRLTHPKFAVEKEYLVWANGQLTDQALAKLRDGIKLSDGKTNSAQVFLIWRRSDQVKFKIIITEGRHRQIRRMAAAAGLTVTRLLRTRMAQLELGQLQPGEVQSVTPAQINSLGKG
jgi:23S rRNA pseudouridine2605 synthase